jgi:hypothetical protein
MVQKAGPGTVKKGKPNDLSDVDDVKKDYKEEVNCMDLKVRKEEVAYRREIDLEDGP